MYAHQAAPFTRQDILGELRNCNWHTVVASSHDKGRQGVATGSLRVKSRCTNGLELTTSLNVGIHLLRQHDNLGLCTLQADPAMQAFMYPMLRDDFQLVETYQVGDAGIRTIQSYSRCR